ncbi:MAG TPA: translocation/assembly module TamB domain-containing protein [Steroidobacteraceae bacterium]|jgi:translocation and assembly module TamB|nr:translocation/assembly module TamB domain-containing protein [Steroidobacteraceae bacterium]
MTRRWRIALIVAAVPVVLIASLWVGLLTVGNTGWGRQHIESLVAYLTSNEVRLHGLGGELPDRPTLAKLELADSQGIWLTAQNIEGVWDPWALLQRRVAVHSAHAQRIDWSRLPVARSHSTHHASIPHIDVQEATADTVNLSAALAGTASTLTVHASAHLRSVTDMQLAFAATRLNGVGTYSLQLAFDRTRMDGAFRLREPGHGPLAGLTGVPDIGDVVVSGDLAGPRQAEHINVQADLGDLHAHATGVVDLVHASANLEYAADATAMTPRADLTWQQLHVRGNWQGPLATATAAAQVQAQGLQLPGAVRIAALNASLASRAGNLNARARLEGASAPGVPSGLFAAAPLVAEGSIQLAQPTRPFELRVSHPSLNLQAKGRAAGTQQVDADIDAPNVALLLQAVPLGLSGALRLHARVQRDGSAAQIRLTASGNLDSSLAQLHGWMRGPETADIRATYQASGLTIEDSVISNQALSLAASGRLAAPSGTEAAWTVSAKTRATLADLSILLPTLAGRANIRAQLSGSTGALRTAGDLDATLSVHGSAAGAVRGTFDVGDLPHAPKAQVTLRGSLGAEPVSLQAQVQVNPGESVHIDLPQAAWRSVHAQGNLTLAVRDLDRSQGQFKWSIADLSDLNELLGQHFAGQLSGSLNLAPTGKDAALASTSLQVNGTGLQIGAQKFDATLTGSGPLHALQLTLAAQAPLLGKPASLTAQGQFQSQQHSLTVTAANATVYAVDLKLEQPAVLDFAQGLAVSGLRISAADAHLRAQGQVLPQLQVTAELTDATPGLIDAILPGYLDSGTLKASLQLQGSVGHPLGQLRVTGTDLRAPGDAGSLPPVQLTAAADLGSEGAKITLRSSAGDATHMSVEGSIPWNGPLAVTLSGNVDLARFNPLLEGAGRRISGKIDVNAQVAGTLAAPTVKGSVQLHKGTVHDYRHGIDLTEIEGLLEGTENQLRITQLTGHAAAGTITVSGTLGVLQGGWPVDLKLTARNAQPFASSIVSGNVDADLTLTGTVLHELTLGGSVLINRANVEIPNNFPPNVAVLDVRRPGQVVTPPPYGPVFNIKVSVNAPRQILVRGRGLEAELGGRLQIGGTARAPAIDGGFDLHSGLFTLAGSRLNFQSGRISFTGEDITGKIDPTLDFTAQTTTVDTTVTLRITGVADAPQFELSSVPQLPQDEILARLLFGESAGQLTAIQAAQIGAALVTLTGVGTGLNPLVEIQKHLGLDRLAVGSNDTGIPGSTQNNGATIEAGRYLTNRIFLDVKQNTTGATQLQVQVDLTSKLKLQTQVGTGTATVQGTTPDNDPGSSVGLSYRFEY